MSREIVLGHPGVREFVRTAAPVDCRDDAPCIGVLRGGAPLGGVVFTAYTGASVCLHMAGRDERWACRDLLALVFRYVFVQLGCRKAVAPVASTNTLALAIDTRLGFVPEAVIRDACPDGDLMILTMRREHCRWLSLPMAHERAMRRAA